MNTLETEIEAEKNRRAGTTDLTSAARPVGGSQKALRDDIDSTQGASCAGTAADGTMSAMTEGNYTTGATSMIARDKKFDDATKTLETDIAALSSTLFACNTLTITNTSDISGHLKMMSTSTFNFPVMTGQEAKDDATMVDGNSSNNGKVFCLNNAAATDMSTTPFTEGSVLYFCENGIWHSSHLLKDDA